MPVSELTPLPPAPSIADPTNFEAEADALLGALPVMVTELNAAFGAINDTEEDLADLVANAGYSGTSSTSLTVGTGSKALTTQANRSYVPGVFVLVADSANPVTNFMIGVVTAYNPTTGALTFTSVLAGGSGTIASWLVSLSGKPGTDATVTFASEAELRALTVTGKAIDPDTVADASTFATLTDAATIAVNMANGPNFSVTLGGNRTLGAPTNAKPGTTGCILIKQDATGSRTLAYNTAWVPFGATPSLTTTANAVDLLIYVVETSSKVRFTLTKGGAA